MRIGIFAKTFKATGGGPVLAAVAKAGYDVAQFNMACLGGPSMPGFIAPAACAEIAEASRRSGVAIAAVSGTYNMIHPDPAVRADGLARLATIIRAARAMDTSLVTLCTGTRDAADQWKFDPENSSPEAWRDLLVEMGKAVAIAEEAGVDLGIEPELANVVATARDARRLIDELRSQRLRIVLDPANLFESATPDEARDLVARATGLLGDRLAMVHAKDRDAEGRVVAAGRGVVDFPHFALCLRSTGFDGPLVTHGLSEEEAPGVAVFLRGVVAEALAA